MTRIEIKNRQGRRTNHYRKEESTKKKESTE